MEEEVCTFTPNIGKHFNTEMSEAPSVEERTRIWEENRKRKLEQKAMDQQEEPEDECTFTPQIVSQIMPRLGRKSTMTL